MLTIERNASHISVAFKARVKLWTHEFTKALLLAFSLHLMALLFFHVDIGLFPPIPNGLQAIKVSSKASSIAAITEVKDSTVVPSFLLVKREEKPSLPTLPLRPAEENRSYSELYLPSSSDLKDIRAPSHAELHFSGPDIAFTEPLFGLMAAQETKAILLFKAFNLEAVKGTKLIQDLELGVSTAASSFKESGHIFWLAWLQSTGDLQLDRRIEQLLRSIPLKISSQNLVAEGTVEVEFRIDPFRNTL